jgi:hypothetical protein
LSPSSSASTNELLVVLSVGVPIGLGVYWAWVHRDWSARSKRVGLVAAAAGSLAGAWLGLHATEVLLALLTAIAAALAGANLSLILLDMSRARSNRNQSAALRRRRMRPGQDLERVAPTDVRSP